MQLYLKLKSIPELTGLSRSARQTALRSCRWKIYHNWQVHLALVVFFACTVAGCAVGDWLIPDEPTISQSNGQTQFVWSGRIPLYIGAAIGGIIGGAIFGQISMHHIRPYLRAYLRNQDTSPNEIC